MPDINCIFDLSNKEENIMKTITAVLNTLADANPADLIVNDDRTSISLKLDNGDVLLFSRTLQIDDNYLPTIFVQILLNGFNVYAYDGSFLSQSDIVLINRNFRIILNKTVKVQDDLSTAAKNTFKTLFPSK